MLKTEETTEAGMGSRSFCSGIGTDSIELEEHLTPVTVPDSAAYSRQIAEEYIHGRETDPFSEDETELRFLRSKPTCFMIMGKPGAGKTTLATLFAREWKCELLSSAALISQQLQKRTELGKLCAEVLLQGNAVPEEVVFQMIVEKINSPEVAHHGYILDDMPCLSESTMTISDQLAMIQNWKLRPDFLINIQISDEDLFERRSGLKVDPVFGGLYTKDVYAPEKPPKTERDDEDDENVEEEEDESSEEDDEQKEVKLPKHVVDRLVTRPEDMSPRMEETHNYFSTKISDHLKTYVAAHDPQCVIHLDGNRPPAVLAQQLQTKLRCFLTSPAAIVQRLREVNEEEEEQEDVTDYFLNTDDLMRTLASRLMIAPRFRWRRSRWLRYCPVALYDGKEVQGGSAFAVSFLDKIYCLSSAEALELFRKNPRPYLLPPQPRPPCKLSVLGPPLSGKSTLCQLLAHHYGAEVLDVEQIIRPRVHEEKLKLMKRVKKQTTAKAIEAVIQAAKNKAARLDTEGEAAEAEAAETEAKAVRRQELGGEVSLEEEHTMTTVLEEESGPGPQQSTKQPGEELDESRMELTAQSSHEFEAKPHVIRGRVDATHPEVVRMVAAALAKVEKEALTLPAEVIVEIVQATIDRLEEDRQQGRPDIPEHGGWILDDFPSTVDLWEVCLDKDMVPDSVLFLTDESQGSSFLAQRYYHMNRDHINAKRKDRLKREREEALRAEEEKRRQEAEAEAVEISRQAFPDETRSGEDTETAVVKDGESVPSFLVTEFSEPVSTTSEKTATTTATTTTTTAAASEKKDDEAFAIPTIEVMDDLKGESSRERRKEETDKRDGTSLGETGGESTRRAEEWERATEEDGLKPDEESQDRRQSSVEFRSPQYSEVFFSGDEQANTDIPAHEIVTCPEMASYVQNLSDHEKETTRVMKAISTLQDVQPIIIDVHDKTVEDVLQDAINQLEKPFRYEGWEYTLYDRDEEDEDRELELAARDEEEEMEEEEEEEEENEDSMRSRYKMLGETSYFCPVALKKSWVLRPGIEDWSIRYRERLYYLSSAEAQEQFLADTTHFLPLDKPLTLPPLRILILGVRGSGKTFHGRRLAERLGLFHIAFKERLQELLLPKTKARVVPTIDEYKEEKLEEDDNEEEEEEKEEGNVDVDAERKESRDVLEPITETNEEEEKDDELTLTEEEEVIRQSIINSEGLNSEILEKLVPQWWNKEPFCSTGFVLEGFPRTAEEVKYLAEMGLFPDAVVLLNLSEQDMKARLLPPWLDKWKRKMKLVRAKNAKRKKRAQKKREAAIQKRREELLAELAHNRAERAAQRAAEREETSDDESDEEEEEEEDDDEEQIDIESIINAEFEEEEVVEEEPEETEADATAFMMEDLNVTYQNTMGQLQSLQVAMEECSFFKVDIDAGRKPHIVSYLINKNLRGHVDYRRCLFEHVYPLSEKVAEKMLALGYKKVSRFGRWCPVKLLEGDCLPPLCGIPGRRSYPCLHRQYVYFLHSAAARDAFILDPLTHLQQPSPKPVVSLTMAILGPPKAGKSTLAKRFAEDYGLLRLSVGEAMRTVLLTQPKCHLARQMNQLLLRGQVVPPELQVQALELVMLDTQCQTRGYVLDGYPMTRRQTELLEERHIVPAVVIHLELGDSHVLSRGTLDRTSPKRTLRLHDSDLILQIKTAAFRNHVTSVLDLYATEHQNVEPVDPTQSKWWVWNRTLEIARFYVSQRQLYFSRRNQDKAAPLADLGVTPGEFQEKLGEFGQFCPVSLAAGEFVDGTRMKSMKFVAEFQGRYYKMAGEAELQTFLAKAEKFVPPEAPYGLPPEEWLPKRRLKEELQQVIRPVEMRGYCPVTYLDGKLRYEALEPGNPELIVEYLEKIYYVESEDKLWKFMRTPEKYSRLQLPHKLPPSNEVMPVTGLPMLGYLEQGVSSALMSALTATGNFKPKYPFQSPSRSALLYTAFHLKAYNPKSSAFLRKKYKQKLQNFEDTCNLIRYLGDNMSTRYQCAEDMPPDFNAKLEMFFALEGIEPTTNWIV